jgi:hypothetical protein
MGILTWIIIAIVILAIVGLGWQAFIAGVFKGAEKIMGGNPVLRNTTEKVKHMLVNITKSP